MLTALIGGTLRPDIKFSAFIDNQRFERQSCWNERERREEATGCIARLVALLGNTGIVQATGYKTSGCFLVFEGKSP